MLKKEIRKLSCLLILLILLILQSGCSLAGRLKQPIEDFRNATSVVVASARVGYSLVNDIALDDELRKAQCAQKRPAKECRPTDIDVAKLVSSRTISNDGMKARLDALESLDKYVTLLAELVNSDKPERITAAADDLQKSIDSLAVQITKLEQPDTAGAADAHDSAVHAANQKRFIASVGIFSNAIGIILSALGNRKRDKALKKAVLDGDKAVKEIIAGLKSDFSIFWSQKKQDANNDIHDSFSALNTEIEASGGVTATRPDSGTLARLRSNVIQAVKNRDIIVSTDPDESLTAMATAHDELVKLANEPTENNFIASAAAIQAYLGAATRLGGAIIKLHQIKIEEEAK